MDDADPHHVCSLALNERVIDATDMMSSSLLLVTHPRDKSLTRC